mmetsp:Transcript_14860/g.19859  ORF Transcript_14860/g.19859 Transcript_14860/m.19859 type:complete len:163 (+) Transcript_14860:173-661(+)
MYRRTYQKHQRLEITELVLTSMDIALFVLDMDRGLHHLSTILLQALTRIGDQWRYLYRPFSFDDGACIGEPFPVKTVNHISCGLWRVTPDCVLHRTKFALSAYLENSAGWSEGKGVEYEGLEFKSVGLLRTHSLTTAAAHRKGYLLRSPVVGKQMVLIEDGS